MIPKNLHRWSFNIYFNRRWQLLADKDHWPLVSDDCKWQWTGLSCRLWVGPVITILHFPVTKVTPFTFQ